MKAPVIKRFISNEKDFEDIKEDFNFLVDKIKNSGFEYDLQIRDNYFNLYYKGNSIGKIAYKNRKKQYEVTTHHKFVTDGIIARFGDDRAKKQAKSDPDLKKYLQFRINRDKLHPFFSSQNLTSMSSKVKKVNFQEELIFEQMLMTDNINRKDLIIIDRQVMDKVSKTKMDLLALKQKKGSEYQFCVLEVKLGNNPELEGKVISQLNKYINRIKNNFADYKNCYERNFIQKRKLSLIGTPVKIKIVKDVLGVVVVGAYSRLAKQSIMKLKNENPKIKVIQLSNKLNLNKLK